MMTVLDEGLGHDAGRKRGQKWPTFDTDVAILRSSGAASRGCYNRSLVNS